MTIHSAAVAVVPLPGIKAPLSRAERALSNVKDGVIMKKEVAELVDALLDQGFDLKRTNSGHMIVSKRGVYVWTLPGTPSGQRWRVRTLTKLRAAGFVWPHR